MGLLLSRGPIVAPYEPLFRDNFAGRVLQSLDYSAGILAAPFRDGEVRGLFSNQYPNGRELMDAKMGVVLAAAPVSRLSAGAEATEAFHYTFAKYLRSIQTNGLRQGSYATRSGALSPLQAQIELALPANRGLPDALVRIDLAGLRRAGYEIPELTRVSSRFGLPGGGYEMQFPYSIPPQFITVVH